MEESEEGPNMELEPFNMEACRICLATDVKMSSLSDPYLAGCMKEMGLNNSREWLPNFICYECLPTLIKCSKFIEKSKVVEEILCGLYSKSKVVIKGIIKEQHRLNMKLQSPLKCYLLQDYFYIRHEDCDTAADDDAILVPKTLKEEHEESVEPVEPVEPVELVEPEEPVEPEELDEPDDVPELGFMEILARYVPMRLISPLSDDSPSPKKDFNYDQALATMIAAAQKEQNGAVPVPNEMTDDNDEVVTIEDEVPVVEIFSDEEKIADEPIPDPNANGLMCVDVNTNARGINSFVGEQSSLICPKKRIALSDIPIPKSRKKKKKKHKEREYLEDDECVKRTFRIEVVQTKDGTDKKYTCKFCTKTYSYGDEAKEHYLLGCPQRHNNHNSRLLNANSGVKTWQEWTGNS